VSPKATRGTRSLKMLREIIKASKRRLTIEIPEQYVNKQIEILILPFFEMDSHLEIEKHEYDEDLQRLFRNAPNIKVDKNVDIDALMNEVNDVVL
jgi:hypothetical protein